MSVRPIQRLKHWESHIEMALASPSAGRNPGEYCRINLSEVPQSSDEREACDKFYRALILRKKYIMKKQYDACTTSHRLQDSGHQLVFDRGVFRPVPPEGTPPPKAPHSIEDFMTDYEYCKTVAIGYGSTSTYAHKRLATLSSLFDLHAELNRDLEDAQVQANGSDFYNVMKVDNHVHLAAAMNASSLLEFVREKLRDSPGDIVMEKDGQPMTLEQVFEQSGINAENLTLERLGVQIQNFYSYFKRFDLFNQKFNPLSRNEIRTIFLKTDNDIQGRYFAEITRKILQGMPAKESAEFRLSVYGRNPKEWSKLARWVLGNNLVSPRVRWMVQVPRLYSMYKQRGLIENFAQYLDNIFRPLFEATINPAAHPEIDRFLRYVGAFDSVDDESLREEAFQRATCPANPADWDSEKNPPYAYYLYFMYANLTALNRMRLSRGLNTFAFRPHSGEAGSFEHLIASFLLADHINHGLNLMDGAALQYLYYLAQIGISVSPTSNNALFMEMTSHPFHKYFKRGLNVSLSTDDPMQMHLSSAALLEEFSVAQKVWRLSSIDLCEIARNSVLQSAFDDASKSAWLGPDFARPGLDGNDMSKSNVPDIRISFRFECLMREYQRLLNRVTSPSLHTCRRVLASDLRGAFRRAAHQLMSARQDSLVFESPEGEGDDEASSDIEDASAEVHQDELVAAAACVKPVPSATKTSGQCVGSAHTQREPRGVATPGRVSRGSQK
eukprot:gnl/Trimastix_PCT/4549.p1 GENE.gnl/Trimastix_PCT/4549~~gnl/Trimastix_PCT/4549.p1  ORF type:complete len:726 (-),score=176.77 gnl/Trimastix_PCT/4549:1056-3233(-)